MNATLLLNNTPYVRKLLEHNNVPFTVKMAYVRVSGDFELVLSCMKVISEKQHRLQLKREGR